MENIRAVVWDFDGVIVDSERLWLEAAPEFYRSQLGGNSLPPDQQQRLVGGSLHNAWQVLREHGLQDDYDAFDKKCVQFAITEMYPHVNLMPGVMDTIRALQATGIRQAIGTSGRRGWFDPTFERLELAPFFDAVVASDDVDGIGKPAPDIFFRCAELIDVDPSECLVIEDSSNGVQSGLNAGMRVWGLRNGFNDGQDLSGAEREFREFAELQILHG